jgi:photoactive yellow protein
MTFDQPGVQVLLDRATADALDELTFGLVRMDRAGIVDFYNRWESTATGLTPERVLGRHFFTDVGPCTNNYLIATRFEDEPALDVVLPYVFTLRMKPSPVTLRLLKSPGSPHLYLLVKR